jgi:hypothetical protein
MFCPVEKANFLFIFLSLVLEIEIYHNQSHWSYVTNQFQGPFGFGTHSTECVGKVGPLDKCVVRLCKEATLSGLINNTGLFKRLRFPLVQLWISENLIPAVSCGKAAVSCELWES